MYLNKKQICVPICTKFCQCVVAEIQYLLAMCQGSMVSQGVVNENNNNSTIGTVLYNWTKYRVACKYL